jgi:hypothetical protein
MSRLFSASTGKKKGILELNIGSVGGMPAGPTPVAPKAYVPDHKFLVGKEPGAYASLQVTEQQAEDRMIAVVAVSFLFLKGTWQAQLLTGELRLFALDIYKVRRGQAGSTRLTLVPGILAFIVYFDEKQQMIVFAVDYCGPLGVHTLPTLPLTPAEIAAVIDSLQTADPGELTEERTRQIRKRAAAASSTPRPGAGKI